MNYYLDTEFYEEPGLIDLISIALVAEDGREFYHGNADHNFQRSREGNPWLVDNVYPHLPSSEDGEFWLSTPQLYHALRDFLLEGAWLELKAEGFKRGAVIPEDSFPQPRFWGYFADYDWVAFCWIFGRMIDLPSWMPKYCLDLKQLAFHEGRSRDEFPPQDGTEHNALEDARWNKKLFEFLAA